MMMMRCRASLFLSLLLLTACAQSGVTSPDSDGGVSTPQADDPTVTGPVDAGYQPIEPADCVPMTAAQVCEAQAGMVSDGCGGFVDCGAPNACTPKTCAELGATCGTIDDGCGHVISCDGQECAAGTTCMDNRCTCEADDHESNELKSSASSLGDTVEEDTPDTYLQVSELNLSSATDIDWYEVDIEDDWADWSWFGDSVFGYVTVEPHTAGTPIQVTAVYACPSGSTEVTCKDGQPYDGPEGRGCQRDASATPLEFYVDCNGADDGGTLYIGVQYPPGTTEAQAGGCRGYSIAVQAQ